MSSIDYLLGVVAPYECFVCGAEGALLCRTCLQRLPPVPPRCYRCYRPSPDGRTCAACRGSSGLHSVSVGTEYAGTAKALIWQIKSSGAKAAAMPMAARLVPLIERHTNAVIVPVPTATGRVRRRGYDQALLLARQLSRRTRLPYGNFLVRSGQTHQVGASREQRLGQLESAFRLKVRADVRGRDVILVDDVLTTGATLEAAARPFRHCQAGKIMAVVFAQARKPHNESTDSNRSPKLKH